MSDTKHPTHGVAWNDGLHFLMRQCTTDSNRWFPGKAQELPNLVLCLAGEVGEVANIVKKNVRGSLPTNEMLEILPEEIVDCLIYLMNLMGSDHFEHIDWMDVWYKKRQFNEERFNPTLESNDV